MRAILLVLVLVLAAACGSPYSYGEINGVSWKVAMDRQPVEGGVPLSLDIRMAGDGTGRLLVDGVAFGTVRTGDRVEVTKEAVVLVNGQPRPPQASGSR